MKLNVKITDSLLKEIKRTSLRGARMGISFRDSNLELLGDDPDIVEAFQETDSEIKTLSDKSAVSSVVSDKVSRWCDKNVYEVVKKEMESFIKLKNLMNVKLSTKEDGIEREHHDTRNSNKGIKITQSRKFVLEDLFNKKRYVFLLEIRFGITNKEIDNILNNDILVLTLKPRATIEIERPGKSPLISSGTTVSKNTIKSEVFGLLNKLGI